MSIVIARGLSPVREVLGNGAVVTVKPCSTTPAVAINLAFSAGSLYDPEDLPGLANFVARVMDRGTTERSADQIADELDSRGVSLQIAVARHLLVLTCTCLEDDFEAILDLLADITRRPSFADEEIARRRGEIVTAIRQDEDNPAAMAVQALMGRLYRGHPYGRRSKGTLASVGRIGRRDLVAFHRERFVPGTLSLAVAGDISPRRVLDSAEKGFGDWRISDAAEPVVPEVQAPASREALLIPMPSKTQVDIAYGYVGVRRSHPDYYAFWVMNNVLGQHGLGGRLGDSIRDRQGMAYYAFSTLDANRHPGPLVIRAGVSAAHVDRTIASIDAEVSRLAESGVTEQELVDTQRYLIGSLPRTLETNAGIASFLQMVEHFGLGPDYDLRLPDLLSSVTRDAVCRAAGQVLDPARAIVAVAGPYPSANAA